MLEGEVTFHVGGENHLGKAGAFVSFPRAIPHTFSIESPAARFLVRTTPGGFEHMFELAPKTPENAVKAMTAFGMEVVGPHPRQAAADRWSGGTGLLLVLQLDPRRLALHFHSCPKRTRQSGQPLQDVMPLFAGGRLGQSTRL